MTFALPAELSDAVNAEIDAWRAADKTSRLWNKDNTVWTGEDEEKWLDWLDIVESETGNVGRYRDFRSDIEAAGFTDVLLMGMGGSSLCPEVLALTFGKTNFHILDSTVPAQIATVEKKLDLTKTLFIVASKSGSTLEPNCFKQYFFDKVAGAVGPANAGKHFVAITDPGSKMEQVAKDDGFRHIFYGKPQIGGRFSALSAFGMTAASSMGIDVEPFLHNAQTMVDACRTSDPAENPGVMLGSVIGVAHEHGRDKLTIFAAPEIHDLGAWLEQLIAESTGKRGVAVIPVDREPFQSAAEYSSDRLFAFLCTKGDTVFDAQKRALEASGHPVISIELDTIDALGQEFFRWEFATAVAGSIMKINPFNQPDVESAKIEARKITDEYEQTGSLPGESPFYEADGISFFSGDDYGRQLMDSAGERSAAAIIRAHLDNITTGDYFGLLGYVEMDAENERTIAAMRASVLERYKCATCVGFGPRFLHSTGQAYKGGANNGVFLQITSDDAMDIPVPDQKFTFGIVKAAQARGDFQVLVDRGRRALRVHLGPDVRAGLDRLASMI